MAITPTQALDICELRKLGPLPVHFEDEVFTAPFSKKPCVWFEWIYSVHGTPQHKGFTMGGRTNLKSSIVAKSTVGDLTASPDRTMLYLAASFENVAIVDGEELYVREFCLEPNQTYHAFAEKFTYHQPPSRFFPFISKCKTTWLLALSDKLIEKEFPLHPLIPTRQGMTG